MTRRSRSDAALASARRWPSVWFSLSQHSWTSLVILPAHAQMRSLPVASALVNAAHPYHERVELIDAEGATPEDVRAIIALIRDHAAEGTRTIVAVGCPLTSHPAIPIARACAGAVLLVPLGIAELGASREVIDTVGHAAFLGAFTVPSYSTR